jgi:hypothetical protein
LELTPQASRPTAPTGYGFSTTEKGMLSWDEVHAALKAAEIYWIGTSLPDGSPNIHPIWGSFAGETMYIEGGATTRWARNIANDPRVSFGLEARALHISGRGEAVSGEAGDRFAEVGENFAAKYEYRPENDRFWLIRPSVIIAIQVKDFANSPTRFTFGQ